jgi:hypothetical protein
MKTRVTKTYKGCIELRDYDVKECIEKKEPIKVEFMNEMMTLSPEDLDGKVINVSPLMKSKVGGKDYHLVAYEWAPDSEEF